MGFFVSIFSSPYNVIMVKNLMMSEWSKSCLLLNTLNNQLLSELEDIRKMIPTLKIKIFLITAI
ncbi:MAG: hypothetical protein CMG55_08455 [Candidatus Marinimicrobia bacterium]|nr:hypothetical protein [Candidatus Neomarinimicrobiota bacterium]